MLRACSQRYCLRSCVGEERNGIENEGSIITGRKVTGKEGSNY